LSKPSIHVIDKHWWRSKYPKSYWYQRYVL